MGKAVRVRSHSAHCRRTAFFDSLTVLYALRVTDLLICHELHPTQFFFRALDFSIGLHRSPTSFAVTSRLGRSHFLPFETSYCASSLTSSRTSSWGWPWKPALQPSRHLAHLEAWQVYNFFDETLFFPFFLLSPSRHSGQVLC